MVFIVGTFGLNFPIYASTMAVYFGKGAGEYGVLSSVLAIGSLTGALLVARANIARMRVVTISAFGFGAAATLASVMPNYGSFATMLVFLGLCTSTMLSTANGFVQSTTDPKLRGRVLSIYFAILMGGTPIGAPFTGWVADHFGARQSMLVAGISGVLAALIGFIWLMVSRDLRVRYRRGSGMFVTHAGRAAPGEEETGLDQALTAPLSVLKREAEPTNLGTLSPHEGIAETGVIQIDDPENPDKKR